MRMRFFWIPAMDSAAAEQEVVPYGRNMVTHRWSLNANGVSSSSPGLPRGTSAYPGRPVPKAMKGGPPSNMPSPPSCRAIEPLQGSAGLSNGPRVGPRASGQPWSGRWNAVGVAGASRSRPKRRWRNGVAAAVRALPKMRWRNGRLISARRDQAPPAWCSAAPGTTRRCSAAPPPATRTTPATGTRIWACVWPQLTRPGAAPVFEIPPFHGGSTAVPAVSGGQAGRKGNDQ